MFKLSHGLAWAFLKFRVIDLKYELGVLETIRGLKSLEESVKQAETERGYSVIDRELEAFRQLHEGPMIAFNACRATDIKAHTEFEDFLGRMSEKHKMHYLRDFGAEIASDQSALCLPYDGQLLAALYRGQE